MSALIGVLAYRRGSLTVGGVVGAILTGTSMFAFGGIVGGALLVTFFVSSSVLSHYRERDKEPLAEKFQKGSRRDLAQALANGGMASILAVVWFFHPEPFIFAALVGALATATADTWATEVGVLSQSPPRLITNLRVVAVGTSGGITILGTAIAFLGAASVGFTAVVLAIVLDIIYLFTFPDLRSLPQGLPFVTISNFRSPSSIFYLPLISALAGLGGSLFDSYLGATVQGIYYCEYDEKETESKIHRCGRETRLLRGWRWLDNDGVNFIASVSGAAMATALFLSLAR